MLYTLTKEEDKMKKLILALMVAGILTVACKKAQKVEEPTPAPADTTQVQDTTVTDSTVTQ